MTRIMHKGLLIVASRVFKGGFVTLHGQLVMEDYKVRGPVFCTNCGLRPAIRLVTLERGPFKLCNRLVCGICTDIQPKCLCGKDATRTVVVTVSKGREVLTYQDELCDKCDFTKDFSLVETWRVPTWRKEFQPDAGEYRREIKYVRGKLTVIDKQAERTMEQLRREGVIRKM